MRNMRNIGGIKTSIRIGLQRHGLLKEHNNWLLKVPDTSPEDSA